MSSCASICFIVSTTTLTTMSRLVPPRVSPPRVGKIAPTMIGETATTARKNAPAIVIR